MLARGRFRAACSSNCLTHAALERVKLTRKLIDEGAPETFTMARASSAMHAARLLQDLQARAAESTEHP